MRSGGSLRRIEMLPCPWCGQTPRWQCAAVMCLTCHITLNAFWFEGNKTRTIMAWNNRKVVAAWEGA